MRIVDIDIAATPCACGQAPALMLSDGRSDPLFFVQCPQCAESTAFYPTDKAAIDAWESADAFGGAEVDP